MDNLPTMDIQFAPCLYIVHTFLPPNKGQPLNNGLSPMCPLFGGSTVYEFHLIFFFHSYYIRVSTEFCAMLGSIAELMCVCTCTHCVCSFQPRWEETLVFNEDISLFTSHQNLLLFELLDLPSPSSHPPPWRNRKQLVLHLHISIH